MATVKSFFRSLRRKSASPPPPDMDHSCEGNVCRPNETFMNLQNPPTTAPLVVKSMPRIVSPQPVSPTRALAKKSSQPQKLTVLEIYQSQGCSSCPPANDNVIALAENDQNVLLLTYEVTYWDYLGWKDTFGNKSFDQRQRDYSSAMGKNNVYTPQVRCHYFLQKSISAC